MSSSIQIGDVEQTPVVESNAGCTAMICDSRASAGVDEAGELKTQSVPALERALNILELLAQSQHGVTPSQLTRRLRLPRSTCHALLLTFQRCGYMERDRETGRYRLGFKLYTVATRSLSAVRVRDQAGPILQRLACETRLTVQMAVLLEDEAVLIDRVDPALAPSPKVWLGKRVGMHCTALGKALLAQLPEERASELVLKHGLLRHNENTIVSMKKLRLACEEIRRVGYAVDDGEEHLGIRGIGAPVLSSDGQIIASISVSGASAQISNISGLAARIKSAAVALTHMLDSLEDENRRSAEHTRMPNFIAPRLLNSLAACDCTSA